MYQPLSESLGPILRRKFPEDVVNILLEAFEEFRRKDAVTSEEHQRSIQELKYEIKLVEASLTERIEKIKAETALEMERVKAELLKWIIALWFTQTAALVGIIIALFQYYK